MTFLNVDYLYRVRLSARANASYSCLARTFDQYSYLLIHNFRQYLFSSPFQALLSFQLIAKRPKRDPQIVLSGPNPEADRPWS